MYFLTFIEYNLDTRLVTATWTFLLRSSKGLVHVTVIVSFAPSTLPSGIAKISAKYSPALFDYSSTQLSYIRREKKQTQFTLNTQ